jgi:hypothetical protein
MLSYLDCLRHSESFGALAYSASREINFKWVVNSCFACVEGGQFRLVVRRARCLHAAAQDIFTPISRLRPYVIISEHFKLGHYA